MLSFWASTSSFLQPAVRSHFHCTDLICSEDSLAALSFEARVWAALRMGLVASASRPFGNRVMCNTLLGGGVAGFPWVQPTQSLLLPALLRHVCTRSSFSNSCAGNCNVKDHIGLGVKLEHHCRSTIPAMVMGAHAHQVQQQRLNPGGSISGHAQSIDPAVYQVSVAPFVPA